MLFLSILFRAQRLGCNRLVHNLMACFPFHLLQYSLENEEVQARTHRVQFLRTLARTARIHAQHDSPQVTRVCGLADWPVLIQLDEQHLPGRMPGAADPDRAGQLLPGCLALPAVSHTISVAILPLLSEDALVSHSWSPDFLFNVYLLCILDEGLDGCPGDVNQLTMSLSDLPLPADLTSAPVSAQSHRIWPPPERLLWGKMGLTHGCTAVRGFPRYHVVPLLGRGSFNFQETDIFCGVAEALPTPALPLLPLEPCSRPAPVSPHRRRQGWLESSLRPKI